LVNIVTKDGSSINSAKMNHEMTKEYIKLNKRIGIFSPDMLRKIREKNPISTAVSKNNYEESISYLHNN